MPAIPLDTPLTVPLLGVMKRHVKPTIATNWNAVIASLVLPTEQPKYFDAVCKLNGLPDSEEADQDWGKQAFVAYWGRKMNLLHPPLDKVRSDALDGMCEIYWEVVETARTELSTEKLPYDTAVQVWLTANGKLFAKRAEEWAAFLQNQPAD